MLISSLSSSISLFLALSLSLQGSSQTEEVTFRTFDLPPKEYEKLKNATFSFVFGPYYSNGTITIFPGNHSTLSLSGLHSFIHNVTTLFGFGGSVNGTHNGTIFHPLLPGNFSTGISGGAIGGNGSHPILLGNGTVTGNVTGHPETLAGLGNLVTGLLGLFGYTNGTTAASNTTTSAVAGSGSGGGLNAVTVAAILAAIIIAIALISLGIAAGIVAIIAGGVLGIIFGKKKKKMKLAEAQHGHHGGWGWGSHSGHDGPWGPYGPSAFALSGLSEFDQLTNYVVQGLDNSWSKYK